MNLAGFFSFRAGDDLKPRDDFKGKNRFTALVEFSPKSVWHGRMVRDGETYYQGACGLS